MKIYSTMIRYKEEFRTIEPGRVRMYVCDPTICSPIHTSNTRPMIFSGTVRRYLEYRGYEVNFVSNFTDVGDKIIKTANEENVSASVISERYIVECKKGMAGINVRPVSYNPRATEEIPGMTEVIQKLINGGYAYIAADGTVYYRVESFPDYGKLSHKNIEENQTGLRALEVHGEEAKEGPNDFVLWKPKKGDELYWESPWCESRPDWHVEYSIMSKKYLGETIDIHGSGEDLVFPHHENEIAQSEAVSGKKFMRYWMHNTFLSIDNVETPKPLGNFKTVRQINEEYDLRVLRFFMLSTHYRSPLNFSQKMMDGAKVSLDRTLTAMEHLRDCLAAAKAEAFTGTEEEELTAFDALHEKFEATMGDDFDTADAISVIFEMVKRANITVTEENSKAYIIRVKEFLDRLLDVLGLLSERKKESLDVRVETLITGRQTARREENFAHADEIQNELIEMGIPLEDTKEGVKWKRA